jgi:hypothetical protein
MARLPIPLTPELYTANPPYVDLIQTDPLRLLEATAQFFWETARLDRRRRRGSGRLRLPLLDLQGQDDKMMDAPKTRRWFARLGVEDKTYWPIPAPATPWTSSRIAAGTRPTCSGGCRRGSHRGRPGRRAVVPDADRH